MSTLAQLITAVRDEVSEPTAGFWSDAEITRWINRANYDLAAVAGIESATSGTITTIDGTESYTTPTGFGLVEQVEWVDPNNSDTFLLLTPMAVENRVDGKGQPTGFFILGDLLFLTPKPDAAYTLRVWFYKAGVTLTLTTDTPIIPSRYHDLLTLFAVSQAKRKADDPAYTTYLSDYISGRNGMVAYLRQKGQGNRFSQVIDTDER